jgi:uncharacterized protein RhaS with RHS repeats
MQQRYYDPVAGRFLSIDPVTTDANTGGSFNRYNYANNSPYKYIDPDGRIAFLAALPFILKAADVTITGVELYGAFQTGGASAVAVAAGQNYLTNLVPGMKTGGFVMKHIGKIADIAKSGRKGASGTLATTAGNSHLGNSKNSATSGGDPRAPMQPETQAALDAVENPSRSHGKCCEIDAINKAIGAGEDVKGAKMGPVTDNKVGDVIPTCSTCREVMKSLGVEF